MKKLFNKTEWSWIFYDWANSGYGIIVVTAVLPIWLMSVAANGGISKPRGMIPDGPVLHKNYAPRSIA